MKKSRKIVGIISIGLLIAGSIWERGMEQYEIVKYPAVGSMRTINGHDIHTYIEGEGEVTAIFITGSGTPCAYTDFYNLQKELGNSFKTISFDHAGYGWSERTSIPPTIDNLVSDLYEILNQTAEGKKYILICHSLGSLEAIRFAQLYSDRVKGIVFLDCGSPQFYKDDLEWSAKFINRGSSVLRVVGFNRLLGEIGIKLPLVGENVRYPLLDDKEKAIDEAVYYRYIGNRDNLSTLNLINENAEVVLEGEWLNELPILVLSSDSGKEWEEVQKQLANWSQNSKQVTIEGSSHYIHWSNKDRVLQEINKFMEQIIE